MCLVLELIIFSRLSFVVLVFFFFFQKRRFDTCMRSPIAFGLPRLENIYLYMKTLVPET
jgi:hypothetical protein